MRTSCPHLSLSLSLSCLRRTSAMPFGSWPCAHANSTLLARSLAFDLVLLHARALNIKQQHSESSRSPVVSVRKNCTSLSLSLSLSHHHPEHEDLYARMCVVERETDINRVRGRCRSLVRWGRNASVKIPNRLLAHGSAGPRVYKSATALECLLGSLHVQGEHARVHVLIAWICTNVAT